MPIYDHVCDHCGHRFSAVRSYSDPEVSECPNCGQRPRRLMTLPAIVFKGSGWYKTDSRATPSSTSDAHAKDGGAAKGSAAKDGGTKSEAGSSTDAAKPAASGDKGSTSSGGG